MNPFAFGVLLICYGLVLAFPPPPPSYVFRRFLALELRTDYEEPFSAPLLSMPRAWLFSSVFFPVLDSSLTLFRHRDWFPFLPGRSGV